MSDTFPSDPLAKVRNPDGTVDWPAVGEAEQARGSGCATDEMIGVLDWLHANGGTYYVSQAARQYQCADHLGEHVRQNGGTIITTKTLHGRTTTTRRTFPPPKTTQGLRVRATVRAPRPRARRSSSSSTTAGQDPGDPDPPPRASGYLTLAESAS